jgi:hypothetical protein
MNQVSSIPFGTDANVYQAYAQSANERLGAIAFVFENTGPNTAYIRLGQYDGKTSPSGYASIDTTYAANGFNGFSVAPGGTVTRSYALLSKRIAFFGSGNTIVNVSAVLRNKSDLRGAQIDIVPAGRKGWGVNEGWNAAELTRKWGQSQTVSTSSNTAAGNGNIDSTAANYQPYSG